MAATKDASTAFISPNTNRLVPGGTNVIKQVPVYWCKICSVRLGTVSTALAHLRGKSHKVKLKANGDSSELNNKKVEEKDGSDLECKVCNLQLSTPLNALQHFKGKKHASRKRALDEKETASVVQKPAAKRGKEEQVSEKTATKGKDEVKGESVKCEDCNIEFKTCGIAIQHFKGKRHTATIRKKMEAKQPQKTKSAGQRGGRGRGRIYGRGNSVNTGRFNNVQPPFKPFNAGTLSEYFVKGGQAKINTNNAYSPSLNKVNHNSAMFTNNSSAEARTQGTHQNEQQNMQQQDEVGNRSIQQPAQYNPEANTSIKHRIYEREYEDNIQQLLPNKLSSPSHNNKYHHSSGNFSNNYNQGNSTSFGNHGPGSGNSSNNFGQKNGNNSNNYRQDGGNVPDDYDQSNGNFNNYGQDYSNFPDNYDDGNMDSSNLNNVRGNQMYDTY